MTDIEQTDREYLQEAIEAMGDGLKCPACWSANMVADEKSYGAYDDPATTDGKTMRILFWCEACRIENYVAAKRVGNLTFKQFMSLSTPNPR